eukprot:6028876-Ditylum_brightwellii.AAC.1
MVSFPTATAEVTDLLVHTGVVVFTVVICFIHHPPLPFDIKLSLRFLAFQPVEAHINGFGTFGDHASCG